MRLLLFVFSFLLPEIAFAQEPVPGREAFASEVDRRLEVPAAEQQRYARRLAAALAEAGVAAPSVPIGEYFVLIDRSARVQALFLYWRSPEGTWQFIGAAPVSTGRPGEYEHFLTPLGVFEHTPANPDFRAEGTFNDLGIRGYGREGMRVFDFGWVSGVRTWDRDDLGRGPPRLGQLRLQMHATDPDYLEPLLGTRHSEGCIRIPATLDVFLDRHGILDAGYEQRARDGRDPRVLLEDREPTPTPGRWLVVVETQRGARPAWARPRQAAAPDRRRAPSTATTSSSSTC